MKKRILVTGASGQLGHTFKALAKNTPHQWFFADQQTLDITQKKYLHSFLTKNPVDIVINTAAYTFVDRAEEEYQKAFNVNEKGVQNLAELSLDKSFFLIHFSTDYVFDGSQNQPYKPNDKALPINTYGKSKLAGEDAIRRILSEYLIIRTSWLFADKGENFVSKILQLGKEKKYLKVITDQIGSPTYATDLAEFILYSLEKEISGTYHFTNEGDSSWFNFAKEIAWLAKLECEILPCKTADFPTLAKRPGYSVLDTSQLKKDFLYSIPKWTDALKRYFIRRNLP